MENIVTAKKELYSSLKQELKEVNGAGIRRKEGHEYIVIFISKLTDAVIEAIPKNWKGSRVETEVRQVAKVYND